MPPAKTSLPSAAEITLIDQPEVEWKPDRGENNTGNDKGPAPPSIAK
jgi:hypothetical protein